jgi:hypothetical protein
VDRDRLTAKPLHVQSNTAHTKWVRVYLDRISKPCGGGGGGGGAGAVICSVPTDFSASRLT